MATGMMDGAPKGAVDHVNKHHFEKQAVGSTTPKPNPDGSQNHAAPAAKAKGATPSGKVGPAY